ncbi:hypothetical protein [Streptomyces sannanensis]
MRNTGWCPWRLLLAEAPAHADPAEAKALAQEGVEIAASQVFGSSPP